LLFHGRFAGYMATGAHALSRECLERSEPFFGLVLASVTDALANRALLLMNSLIANCWSFWFFEPLGLIPISTLLFHGRFVAVTATGAHALSRECLETSDTFFGLVLASVTDTLANRAMLASSANLTTVRSPRLSKLPSGIGILASIINLGPGIYACPAQHLNVRQRERDFGCQSSSLYGIWDCPRLETAWANVIHCSQHVRPVGHNAGMRALLEWGSAVQPNSV
jgi:hypothetical protein